MILKHQLLYSIILITLMGGKQMSAQEEAGEKDYALKADFLCHFIDYVHWEDYSKNKTFKIAILEESLITNALVNSTQNKRIEVKEYKNLSDLKFCNILFIPYNCTVPIEKILSTFIGKPILIITEKNGYGKKGAHMNFVMKENKLKFEVNLKAINKAGIGISSFLLQHAIIVQ
jgi:hypothetical protein